VVEGFALRIVRGDIPPQLKDVSLLSLDIGLLQAGASMKGEFENRLRQVIEEVQSSPRPIILFIDEAHTLIGAGGAAGTGDAANLLKPALARGNLRTIAATTWAEYKKYFEKDPALTRRFQVVQVHEPSEDKTILMMRGVASTLEAHHRVQILDEALEAAVRLSHRYIPARQLPDKAVSLMDTACARVAVSQHATPPEVEDRQRRIETLSTELEIIEREAAIGIDVGDRRKHAGEKLAATRSGLAELEKRWKDEQALVTRLLALRARLREGRAPVEGTASELEKKAQKTLKEEKQPALKPEEREKLLSELKELQEALGEMQGDAPLVLPTADEQAVAAVVQDWTGIPVGRMVKNEIESVLRLADTLNQRVIGQKHGLEMIAKRVQTSRAKLDNPSKPIGVFMLAGPSGVGKTETALALAEALYGGEQNVITINMSEYQEAHTVSTLKGAPPGYVGYGEGGVLTEAVRRRPYSVVLLDEVEKAHSDVHEIFFQVFDKGWMEDGEGRYIDFKNTILLLTTNAGSELIMNMCKDPELAPDPEGLARALREPLLKVFPAALLGRIVTIPYYPLSDEMLAAIIRLQIGRIKKRIEENHAVTFDCDDAVIGLVAKRCTELESGGRMIDAIHQYGPAAHQRGVPEAHDGGAAGEGRGAFGGERGLRLQFQLKGRGRSRWPGSWRQPHRSARISCCGACRGTRSSGASPSSTSSSSRGGATSSRPRSSARTSPGRSRFAPAACATSTASSRASPKAARSPPPRTSRAARGRASSTAPRSIPGCGSSRGARTAAPTRTCPRPTSSTRCSRTTRSPT